MFDFDNFGLYNLRSDKVLIHYYLDHNYFQF